MSFRTLAATCAFAALPLGFAQAQDETTHRPPTTLTIVIEGTAGPVISGTDPFGVNGKSATVTVLVSETIKPKSHTTSSATYRVPAGAVTVDLNGNSYQSTSPSKMTVKLGSKADKLVLTSAISVEGLTLDVGVTASLASGSWSSGVLKHPEPFAPSPQTLTSPSSTIKYSTSGFGTTVLGLNGTASNSAAFDPVLPDDDSE